MFHLSGVSKYEVFQAVRRHRFSPSKHLLLKLVMEDYRAFYQCLIQKHYAFPGEWVNRIYIPEFLKKKGAQGKGAESHSRGGG